MRRMRTSLRPCHPHVVFERHKETAKLGRQVLQVCVGLWTSPAPTSDSGIMKKTCKKYINGNIKTIIWKIENRVLDRIGHILSMPDTSQMKIAILGWFKGVRRRKETPRRKRKIQLYWSRILREAGVRLSEEGTMGQDRDRWRDMVEECIEHLMLRERAAEVIWLRRRGLWRGIERCKNSRHSSVTYVERSARAQKEDARRVASAPRFQMPPVQ